MRYHQLTGGHRLEERLTVFAAERQGISLKSYVQGFSEPGWSAAAHAAAMATGVPVSAGSKDPALPMPRGLKTPGYRDIDTPTTCRPRSSDRGRSKTA